MKKLLLYSWLLTGLSGILIASQAVWAGPAADAEIFQAGQTPTVKLRPGMATGAPLVELPALETERVAARAAERSPAVPMEIGLGRDMPAGFNQLLEAGVFTWTSTEDGGSLAQLSLKSTGAQALRAGIQVFSLPDQAELRFYAPDREGAEVFLVTGTQVNTGLSRDAATRDQDSESPLLYWSPIVEGSQLGLQVYLPAGVGREQLRIAIPKLSHIYESRVASATCPFGVGIGCAESCNQDASCHQGAWGQQITAVAKMMFTTEDGFTSVCSGSLVNDLDPDSQIPYFLTARHCISSQSVASSLVTYWGFQSSGCGGAAAKDYRAVTGGAYLLSALTGMDMALLRLKGTPPDGATMVGWETNPVRPGAGVSGIHHPSGDLKKISFGVVGDVQFCELPTVSVPSFPSGTFFCNPSDLGTFLHITFDQGVTEGGSSGSGIFLNGTHTLVGTLTGGSSSCSSPQGSNYYGRFDLAYENSFKRWLGVSDACDKQAGSWAYCTDPACGPCAEGEGDCDSEKECAQGLVCTQDVGAEYGWEDTVDVCEKPLEAQVAPSECERQPGDLDYCADPACGPCALNEGDCDSDSECLGGLVCLSDTGASQGQSPTTDLCGLPPAGNCGLPNGDWQYCSDADCGPCAAGVGDCDNDAECNAGLECVRNVGAKYGFPATTDVCEVPVSAACSKSVGDWSYCSDPACGPCQEGQGDCESAADCATGLVCSQNVGEEYGLPANLDVCEAP